MGLTDLPVELQQAVVSHCDGLSIFSLAGTCQTLRQICDDPAIWRLILHRNWHSRTRSVHDVNPNPLVGLDKLIGVCGHDGHLLRRYAIATLRIKALEEDLYLSLGSKVSNPTTISSDNTSLLVNDDDYLPQLDRYLAFMPHLRAFGYSPRSCRQSVINLVWLWRDEVRTGDKYFTKHPLEGSLEAESCMLRRAFKQDGATSNVHEFNCRLAFCFVVELMNDEHRSCHSSHDIPLVEALSDGKSMGQEHDQLGDHWRMGVALWTIAGLVSDLNRRHGEPHPFHRPSIVFEEPVLANLYDLTHDSLAILKPFNDNYADSQDSKSFPWIRWLRDITKTMITNAGLVTWEGYTWHPVGSGRPSLLGPPMKNLDLRFRKSKIPDLMDCDGEGLDDRGTFTIHTGRIRMSTGCFEALRRNADGATVRWEGVATPFGIVGRFDRVPPTSMSFGPGFFWLWSKPTSQILDK